MRTLRILLFVATAAAIALVVAVFAQARSGGGDDDHGASIRGAGTTIVEGGTGSPSFTPIITRVAFYWRSGSGHFECLALAPSTGAGKPGSGNFDTNIMYVTGPVTSATRSGRTFTLSGTATVTGAGAGSNRPFTATYTTGGPGATLVLDISGLTFKEVLLEGHFGS